MSQRTLESLLWYHILGGLFLGFWFIFALVEDPTWFSWGIFGLMVAAALYAARVTHDILKIALWVLVGVSIGGLFALMILSAQESIIATLITAVGAGLIAAGLPTPESATRAAHHAPVAPQTPVAPSTPRTAYRPGARHTTQPGTPPHDDDAWTRME